MLAGDNTIIILGCASVYKTGINSPFLPHCLAPKLIFLRDILNRKKANNNGLEANVQHSGLILNITATIIDCNGLNYETTYQVKKNPRIFHWSSLLLFSL